MASFRERKKQPDIKISQKVNQQFGSGNSERSTKIPVQISQSQLTEKKIFNNLLSTISSILVGIVNIIINLFRGLFSTLIPMVIANKKFALIGAAVVVLIFVGFANRNIFTGHNSQSNSAQVAGISNDYEFKMYNGLNMVDPNITEKYDFVQDDKRFIALKALSDNNTELYFKLYQEAGSEILVQDIPFIDMKKDQLRTINLSLPLPLGKYKAKIVRGTEELNTFEFNIREK